MVQTSFQVSLFTIPLSDIFLSIIHSRQSDTKQKDVCINPYHYARIGSPGLPPVLVPRFSDPMPAASMMQPSYQTHMQEEHMPQNISYNHNGTFNAPPMVPYPMSPPGMSTSMSPGEMSPQFIGPGSPQYNYPIEGMVLDQKPCVQVRNISRLFGQHDFSLQIGFRRYLIKTLWSGAKLGTMS